MKSCGGVAVGAITLEHDEHGQQRERDPDSTAQPPAEGRLDGEEEERFARLRARLVRVDEDERDDDDGVQQHRRTGELPPPGGAQGAAVGDEDRRRAEREDE